MKIYKVKVNGKVYEVELEAVSESAETIKTEAAPAQAAAPKAAVSGGNAVVKAPIAGKVLSIKVKVGDIVKKGQVVAVIEAMKLENEVPSTEEGTVTEIKANVGAAVNNGDALNGVQVKNNGFR